MDKVDVELGFFYSVSDTVLLTSVFFVEVSDGSVKFSTTFVFADIEWFACMSGLSILYNRTTPSIDLFKYTHVQKKGNTFQISQKNLTLAITNWKFNMIVPE